MFVLFLCPTKWQRMPNKRQSKERFLTYVQYNDYELDNQHFNDLKR